MGTSKSKKTTKKTKPTARKRNEKTTSKASTSARTKAAKIKLNIGGRPVNKSTEVLGVEDSANRESPVEISSSSSSQSSPEGSPPPEEQKAHIVTINFQVFLNHRMVHGEAFRVDFHQFGHYGYRWFRAFAGNIVDDALRGCKDTDVKARRKWKATYGPQRSSLVHHISDMRSWEGFEEVMISRGQKGLDCTIEARYVTKGDPESSPEPESSRGKRKKTPEPPRAVYSDAEDDVVEAKKSTNLPPEKKPRKSATSVAAEAIAISADRQSLFMERLSLLSNYWRCKKGDDCPNGGNQCFVYSSAKESDIKDKHFAITLDDLHMWIKQWNKKHPDDVNVSSVPMELIIKWIRNSENEQRVSGRKGKGKGKEITQGAPIEGLASSGSTQPAIYNFYGGSEVKKEEVLAPANMLAIPRAPTTSYSMISPHFDPIPPPELQAYQHMYMQPPTANSPYFQRRQPSPPSLPYIRHQQRLFEPSSSVWDMRALRESSPIRGDAEIDDQLASFKEWLYKTLPPNQHNHVTDLISIAIDMQYDPDQLKSVTVARARELYIPVGVLDLVKAEVSPWRKWWNSQVNQSSTRSGSTRARTSIMRPSQRQIQDSQGGDSSGIDIVYNTYPEDEERFKSTAENSQKAAWDDILRPGMFDDDYMTEGSNGVKES